MRRWALFALTTLVFASLGLGACTPQEVVDPAAEQAAADLAWLTENKPILDEKYEELAKVQAALEAPEGEAPEGEAPEGEGAEGAEGEEPLAPEELEARATVLQSEIDSLNEDMATKVVSYLNNADIEINQAGMITSELAPEQQLAIDVKIEADLRVAQEYIDKGGDYKRALEIYEGNKKLDPDHPALLAAIATAEDMRWMTEERFSAVKKKMTQDEVRELLGQVNPRNTEEYDDQGVVAWFYRKEAGGAAGVFFKERNKGQGNWQVYNLDYEAIKQQVVGGEGGE